MVVDFGEAASWLLLWLAILAT